MDVHLCTKLYYIHLLYIRDKVVVQEVNVKYIKKTLVYMKNLFLENNKILFTLSKRT